MFKKSRRAVIVFILLIALTSSSIFSFAASASGSARALDSNSKLIFSGVTLKDAGNSVQAFLDFKVKNIENQGVSFTLEYNTDYVTLSNAKDNSPMELEKIDLGAAGSMPMPDIFGDSYDAVQFNEQVFGTESFLVSGNHYTNTDETGMVKDNYNTLQLSCILKTEGDTTNEYIGTKTIATGAEGTPETIRVIKAGNREVTLGSISFRINDPAAFSKLTSDEMQSVFRVQRSDGGDSIFKITYVDMTVYPPIIETEADRNLEYQFNVVNPISAVEVNQEHIEVSAAEIYGYSKTQIGSLQDLIAYLNANLQDITVKYANGLQLPSTILWGENGKNFSFRRYDTGTDPDDPGNTPGTVWNPRGGIYVVKQKFNDDVDITVTVNVTPVNIIGFATNDSDITYTAATAPDGKTGLKLPTKARPIFDQALPDRSKYSVILPEAESWTQTSPTVAADNTGDFFQHADGTYVFSCTVSETGENGVSLVIPWATLKADTVSVTRYICAENRLGAPRGIKAKTDDDGLMTILVSTVDDAALGVDSNDGLPELPAGMDFAIRMPNGEVIDRSTFGGQGRFEVKLNTGFTDDTMTDEAPMNGKAIIYLKAGDTSDPQQLRLQQYINMGVRMGDFSLAAKSSAMGQGPWNDFFSNSRRNIYLSPAELQDLDITVNANEDKSAYVFDYSSLRSALFPFYEGAAAPPLTVRLAGSDFVGTRYDGTDGLEPGRLTTITVDSWEFQGGFSAEGDTLTATKAEELAPGTVAVFKGRLSGTDSAPASYSGFGQVVNAGDVEVILKAAVTEAPAASLKEEIRDIKDFVFDQRAEGYTSADLQTKEFTIESMGTLGIQGISVTLSPTTASNLSVTEKDKGKSYDAFTLVSQPSSQIAKDGSTTFTIRTRSGLPKGTYTATVTIGANDVTGGANSGGKKVLDTFQISFTVSEKNVFAIEVIIDPSQPLAGSATVMGGNLHSAGETVYVSATPIDSDYNFSGWEVVDTQNLAPGAVTFAPDSTSDTVSFTMPDMEDKLINPGEHKVLQLRAVFTPTDAAMLKLQKLQLFNPDDSINPLLDDRNKAVTFDPSVRAYNAIAESDVKENKAQFQILQSTSAGAISVSAVLITEWEEDGKTQSTSMNLTAAAINAGSSGFDGNYEISAFPLAAAPAKNKLVISETLKVKGEDGSETEETRSYTVTIYRKRTPDEMVQFGYGNSPYGLIMREAGFSAEQKETAKEKFSEGNSAKVKNAYNTFIDEAYAPTPIKSGRMRLIYRADAWDFGNTGQEAPAGTTKASLKDGYYINYDKDDSALFVYTVGDSGVDDFNDPGILSLTDSLGNPIDLATTKIKREISVAVMGKAGAASNLINDFTTVTTKQLSSTVNLNAAGGNESDRVISGLADSRVRPGIYFIKYTFQDYDGTDITVERPLIVLGSRGDVNLDGSADDRDGILLTNRYQSRMPYTIKGYEAGGALYKYRMCDANTDRNVNFADKNYIKKYTNMVEFY